MSAGQDERYAAAAAEYGQALQRLAHAAEANPERRRDLLQDMHVALWRSFAAFDGRCSERTWVYRVANNVAATHIGKESRANRAKVSLDQITDLPAPQNLSEAIEESDALERLRALIRALPAPDRQIITLYLEGLDAAAIGEIVGLSSGAIATRISRLKSHLAQHFQERTHV
ncbi:MAG TPA: RNA polymerase sigma factor [Vitreimonas sp.]|jgi:RNA polymerase sigma-70 factor (ECF subfamily)|nr:RNA polymerase sigma factor [Vitreimonas sp.]